MGIIRHAATDPANVPPAPQEPDAVRHPEVSPCRRSVFISGLRPDPVIYGNWLAAHIDCEDGKHHA